MKQIKLLIRKKVLLFSQAYNIEINADLKQKYFKHGNTMINQLLNNSNKKYHKKVNDYIETILEEDESFDFQTGISEKNLNNQSTKEKSQSINTLEFQRNNSTTKHHINKKRVVNFKQDFNKTDIIIVKNSEKYNPEKIGKKNILKNSKKTITFKEEIKKEIKNNNEEINENKDKNTDSNNDIDK